MTALTHREANARFGATLAVGTLAMFFVALLFAYAYLRTGQRWPPAELPLYPSILPTVNLGVVGASSVFLERALRGERRALWIAVLLGVLFLGLQGALWAAMIRAGFVPAATGAYGAVFFAITFAHAAHLAVGVAGLVVAARDRARLSRWAIYWHFVGAVWAAIVITVFWL
jgi:heme/copper-type cytochrome/quinol oxidase subunit 3